MKCSECKKDFPSELLHQMCINGEYTEPICGICALELTNELRGVKLTSFKGKVAQEMLERALEHLKK